MAREWGSAEIYQMVKEKYEAAPKPKKDKKGNLRQPPPPQITIPGLNKVILLTRSAYPGEGGRKWGVAGTAVAT